MQGKPNKATEHLIQSYLNGFRQGLFPMGTPNSRNGVDWYLAKRRGIIPLSNFRFPRRLRRTARRHEIVGTVDRDFRTVVNHCADRETGWINDRIAFLFTELHRAGIAHSVEVRVEGRIVGGLYGTAVGGVFSGESMFSLFPSASQFALLHLVDRLKAGGFQLLDVQFKTEHLERFGAIEISSHQYMRLLQRALMVKASFPVHPSTESTASVLQRISQTS